jgi:putative transposase
MLTYDVDTIVHEDLRSLSPPGDEGTLSWELSSWARREIIQNIEYRADCAGVAVEQQGVIERFTHLSSFQKASI